MEIRNGTSEYSMPNLNKEEENPFNRPIDLVILRLFSFCDRSTLQSCSLVCKYWNQLATESTLPKPLTGQPDISDRQDSFKISIGTIANAKEIAEVVVSAFSKDIFRKVGQRRTSTNEVIEQMSTLCNRWYILTDKTKVAAAMLYISDSHRDASINMLTSHPDYQGQKLGTILIKKAETVAKQQGKTNLNLSAAHTNARLINHYEKFGFKKTEDCKEDEYFPPDLQKEYLIPEYQGYEEDGRAKLRNYDMSKLV